jgi:hypothetical protein
VLEARNRPRDVESRCRTQHQHDDQHFANHCQSVLAKSQVILSMIASLTINLIGGTSKSFDCARFRSNNFDIGHRFELFSDITQLQPVFVGPVWASGSSGKVISANHLCHSHPCLERSENPAGVYGSFRPKAEMSNSNRFDICYRFKQCGWGKQLWPLSRARSRS